MDAIESFTESIVDNLRKNGFPERKVAFSIERLYESADKKGLSFNTVLDRLAERGIAHEKTPERVIFAVAAPPPATTDVPPDLPTGFPSDLPFMGMDPAALQGMSPDQLMAAAAQAAQQMSPQQMEAIQSMVGNMSPEQLSALMEQAKKLGLG